MRAHDQVYPDILMIYPLYLLIPHYFCTVIVVGEITILSVFHA